MRLSKLAAVGLAVALALTFAYGTAQAATIFGQDDDIEFIFTWDGTTLTPKTSGAIAEGDVIVSVFELPTLTVDGVSQIPAGSEATGISVIQVGSIVGSTFNFEPFVGGFNFVSPVDVTGGDAGEGAMVAIFLNDFDINLQLEFGTIEGTAANCTSFNECVSEATEGDLLQVDGFAGDPDEFWQSTVNALGGDVGTVRGASGTTLVASFNAALTTFENNIPDPGTGIGFMDVLTGLPCPDGTSGDDTSATHLLGCVAGPTLSGTILGGLGLNDGIRADGAFARSDFDAQKLTSVPAPAALALLGIGLLGLAAVGRRRR